MDFDVQLNKLIDKYKLYSLFDGDSYLEYLLAAKLKKMCNERDARVAVWGAGQHTEQLFKVISPEELNVSWIIDKNNDIAGVNKFGYKVESPEAINSEGINTIIISSQMYRKEIIAEITTAYPQCKWIDIYEIFTEVDAFSGLAFYLNKDYHNLFVLRRLYEKSEDKSLIEKYLWELIISYVKIRDFVNAERYSKEYIGLQLTNYKLLTAFLEELNILLAKLRKILLSRRQKDIGMFMVDALRTKDVLPKDNQSTAMPYLNKLAHSSIAFTNAFSTSIYTFWCLASLFNGNLPLDDDTYKKASNSINFAESPLLQYVKEQNYKMLIYSNIDLFTEEAEITQVGNKEARNKFRYLSEPAPKILWEFVCALAKETDVPVFSLLHFSEIHYPFICGFHRNAGMMLHPIYYYHQKLDNPDFTEEKALAQHRECLEYVDTQLAYYTKFLSANTLQIIFGDHGQPIAGDMAAYSGCLTWYDSCIHVPLIIYNSSLKPSTYDKLFSMKDFSPQIMHILQHGELREAAASFVLMQRDPIYGERILTNEKFIESAGYKFIKGFKVVRGDADKYVLYDDGTEEYYLLPDELNNLIDHEKYRERVTEMRKNLGKKDFPDFDEDKYSLNRRVLKAKGLFKSL